jgi:hypothetical protein
MNAVTFAVLAVVAREVGDHAAADDHLRSAQRHSRNAARRQRQLVEIAALIVAGEHQRARDLSFEHTSDFPADDELLTSLFRPLSGNTSGPLAFPDPPA